MKRQICLWASVAALLLSLAAISPALALTQIPRGTAAYFEGGVDSIDTYPGVAGDGWATGWQTKIQDTFSTVNVTLTDASPLSTGTNHYAHVDMTALKDPTSTKAPYATLGRKYDSLAIDPTQDYTINTLFRVDEDVTPTFGTFHTNGSDRYQLYQSSPGTSLASGVGASSTWIIGAYGGSYATSPTDPTLTAAGNWIFDDYIWDGSTSTLYRWDTGINLTQGVTYSFQVTVHPNYTWDATISAGTTSYNKQGMGLRTRGYSAGYVEFFGRASNADETRNFSVDSVVVAQAGFNTVGGMNQVVAQFNGGNSTTAVDGYAGAVGNGWNTAWQQKTNLATLTATVVSPGEEGFQELRAGTGAYLKLTADGDAGITDGNAGVGRDYTRINADGIDWTKAHTIQFKIRIDETDLSSFTGHRDRYQITDYPSVAYTTGTPNTWAISSYGAEGTNVDLDKVGKWLFADGDGAGNVVSLANSNIALTAGGVYDFTVVVDPTDKTYDVSVFDGTTTGSVTGLHWRTSAATVGGFVNFCAEVDSGDDLRAWSIDEIRIFSGSIPGDANLDGYVNTADATILAHHWGQTNVTVGASFGDFNGDQVVNAADAAILAANWTGATEGAGVAGVPEPCSLVLIGLGVFMLAIGRRRTR